MRIGYIRVSTQDQNTDLQIDAMSKANCDKTFTDKVSGSKANRPELDKMKEVLREGDTLVIWKLSRLGRSTRDLIDWSDWLRKNKIEIVCLTEGIDTSTIAGRLMFTIMAAFAQAERETIVENTHAGLASARARGRIGGRKDKLSTEQKESIKKLNNVRTHSVGDICKLYKISKPTFYKTIQP